MNLEESALHDHGKPGFVSAAVNDSKVSKGMGFYTPTPRYACLWINPGGAANPPRMASSFA
jgi:hypothetical protein